MATARRRVNYIDKLFLQDRVVGNPEELKKAIASHFEALYNQKQDVQVKEFDGSFRVLKKQSVNSLESLFIEEEVWGVI